MDTMVTIENSTDDQQPSAKRLKPSGDDTATDDDASSFRLDVLSSHILSQEDQWTRQYQSATPYKHGRLTNVFVDGFLENVLGEIKQTTKVNFKESDLFRVYQSVDLGNLKEDDEQGMKLPTLIRLKQALYSKRYREFVERVASLPKDTLTEEVDCAANCHAPGCHLLCHDDVIGTRKISFIVYLTGEDWTADEGGCLELYSGGNGDTSRDSGIRNVPDAFPSKTVLPTFNSMAFFEVSPGVSFHSVQEVFGGRPRLSIQGWYHAKEVPTRIEDATLNRLKSTAKGEDTDGEYTASNWTDDGAETDSPAPLLDVDRAYLSRFINDTYLKDESIVEIQQAFEEEDSVQLRKFLLPQWADRIQAAAAKQDGDMGRGRPPKDYEVGLNSRWKAVGPAHKQRFLEFAGSEDNDDDDAGTSLHEIETLLFQSQAFGRYLKRLTSLGVPLGFRGRVRRFRPGLDYTVAHYGILTTEAVLDATLCFAAGTGEQSMRDEETGDVIGSDDDALWDSGDCGGFECYIAADDEEDEAAAEYNAEDDTELLSVSASNNTLSLVYRDPGTMRFVKYVGCQAPSSRWDISMEYQLRNDDDEEGKGEGEGEGLAIQETE